MPGTGVQIVHHHTSSGGWYRRPRPILPVPSGLALLSAAAKDTPYELVIVIPGPFFVLMVLINNQERRCPVRSLLVD